MQKHRVTIKDMATRLNISVSTVSRALRNAVDINQETREAVLSLAEEVSYEPNYFAQSLVNSRTRIIGVIVPVINSNYFSQALSGMTDVANENNYYLIFCQSNETASQELTSLKKLLACNVDGLLISISKETNDRKEFEKIVDKEVPIVMFDRILPDLNCNKVIVDEFEGAFKAVEHLIKKGCTRIAHVSGPDNLSVSINRLNGYIHALEHHHIKVEDKFIIHCKGFEEDALKAVNKLIKLDPMPDGIFFINDLSAIIGIRCLRKHNIRVPEDVRIVGFNDDPVSKVIDPPLTTVMQPGYEVGKLAMGILIDEIENKVTSKNTIMLRTRLVVRKSSR